MSVTPSADPPEEPQAVAAVLDELAVLTVRRLSVQGDLSLTAATTLSYLDRNGPQRLSVLAARQSVTQPSMTQLVQRLEREGLVCRAVDDLDGRAVRVSVTDAGRALLAERRRRRRERLTEMLGTLSPGELRELTRVAGEFLPLLRRLLEGTADE
ncbi:MarR family winged helix-turn-helix transcriptional regulator [Microbispora rosea]|uniref:DNA-binding transcriptional regulator, MarR family n=1 Tax=Microbispora rosea TaxID=58117 RepID=A0A1N7B9E3_9ACTN|nr:MarR family winged helix-turn-helix transcriptional regulator [Microbispora rosea]GIH51497.1 MarR family transcriptional regulator [Microbispora rosea subsp. rosea]SIR47936.1 DNA-binding transcriptional regulator, MarR family [Microbispora rosea]